MAATEIEVAHARAMTQEEHDQWVQDSFADEQAIKDGLRNARNGLWQAAEALYRFSERSGWVALGHETLGDWLADPEITMARSTYFRMTEAWRELIINRQLEPDKLAGVDLTKVSITLPALKRGKATLEDVVSDAETLGARDLREKYKLRDLASGEDPDPAAFSEIPNEERLDAQNDLDDANVIDVEEAKQADPHEMIERGLAVTLAMVLNAVNEALPPERKAISKDLRSAILGALQMALDAGLLDD